MTGSLVINWLVPEPFPGAGGDVGLFRMISYLADFGHRCRVYVVTYDLMTDFSDEQVRAYVLEHFGPSRATYSRFHGTVEEADMTFATFWPTAEELLKLTNGGRRYYLVQDFEPSFYPHEPHHYGRAEATYRADLHCITLGPWLAKLLRTRYQATADHFDFAVDTNLYRPRPRRDDSRPRICFYARPKTARRAYELGVTALDLVKHRIPEAEICFFGTNDLEPPPPYPHRNCGKLSQTELAELFSQSDIGVVFSLSNPSFVPLEMMACGCAVVELASERWNGILTHGENACLVAPAPKAVAKGVIELLENTPLREKQISNGIGLTAKMSWRDSARQVESILVRETSTRMQPRALALPSRNFRPRRYGLGAWTEHIYFAYDLVAALQPALLVELGTDRGESYFAFCQSVVENQTKTKTFAVDHWRGDPHAGSYDETTYDDVASHNRSYYSSFSTLLRLNFDDARQNFADGSIDLLHLDGHHTEEAVRHDLESWLPKLRPSGILLLHDVTIQRRGFGVWKVWQELVARGRAWTFSSPPGLGIWQKPPPNPLPPLLELLYGPPSEQKDCLVQHYSHCNQELQAAIASQWLDGSVRSAPMASETVIQVFWTVDGNFREENSTDVRVGHEDWKEVSINLTDAELISDLRIDFYSALTRIEIASIQCSDQDGATVYRAEDLSAFDAIKVTGDCVRCCPDPFVVKVTGPDPQLYLPAFATPILVSGVRMRLRVQSDVG